MKRWKILNKLNSKNLNIDSDELIKVLLENRGIKTKKDIEEFLNPKLENVTTASVGIDNNQLEKSIKRIKTAIERNEQIIVFGDYDVDGITGTAILWEVLYEMKANVLPYIPDRIEEGYGLSEKGIKNLESRIKDVKLIITVDNGIVANEAVDFANKQGIDVIITDHHTIGEKLPDAYSIVHTTKLCGAGISFLLSQQIKNQKSLQNGRRVKTQDNFEDIHLELAALGTVADMVPLTGANRVIVKYGLEALAKTKRPGLLSLFENAGINAGNSRADAGNIGTYEVGFIIAPRLNASGRIANAMDSLRLLCTKDKVKARVIAEKLELINRERQMLMKESAEDAIIRIKNPANTAGRQKSKIKNILIVGHESYNQGIIGLVAGKLVEEFYRPSIVLSIGEKHSKASARSISGFNIIEFLRTQSEFFINVGGHPMAAGFTIETERIVDFKAAAESAVEELIDDTTLTKTLKIDCELPIALVTSELFDSLRSLEPFGMGNAEPVFAAKDVIVEDIRILGKEGKHLKLKIKDPAFAKASAGRQISKIKTTTQNSNPEYEAIAFGMGELAAKIKVGDKIDVAFNVDENRWNGNVKLQLKVRDIKI